MNSIEMTDVDGDALTVISRGNGTWITCTSGPDEVTVGPFPTRLIRSALDQAARTADDMVTTLIGRSGSPSSSAVELTPEHRDRAWEAFTRLAADATLRGALDGALDAALGQAEPSAADESAAAAAELAADLRQLPIAADDLRPLAEQLTALGYRRT